MPQELNLSGLWWGKQSAKGVENTTPVHRGLQVGGDMNMSRDEGVEDWSDLSKYGGQTQWVNSLLGQGSPAIEFTPSEGASLLWLQHGAESTAAGTNNVWTIGNSPASGTFNLLIYDGAQTITITGIVNTVTSAALDTSIEAAMAAAGYGANAVVCAGGPLNTTPITVTFNGVTGLGTAAKPFYLTKAVDTTSPAVSLTNTTPGVRLKHTFIPSLTAGFYATFVRRVGGSTLTQRHAFLDCRIGGNVIEGSTANKALRITPTIISLDPFKVVAADPAATLPTGADLKPFLYTEATGTFTFNGVALNAQSSFTLTLSEDLQPVYGDDAVPYDFAVGNPAATLGITLIFDATTAAQWNYLAYGTTAPTTGAKPLRQISSDVTYSAWFKQKDPQGNFTGNEFKLTIPRLHTPIPDAPAPNPGGGNAEVTLAGTILPPGGATNPYTIDVNNGDVAYTV
jgi:hypothetical protein